MSGDSTRSRDPNQILKSTLATKRHTALIMKGMINRWLVSLSFLYGNDACSRSPGAHVLFVEQRHQTVSMKLCELREYK